MTRILLAGSSGLIGTALTAHLTARGDEVVRLVRRPVRSPDERRWAPGEPLAPEALAEVDVVVNLAGAGVGDRRWTSDYRRLILSSRVDTTRTLAVAVAASGRPVRFVNASAVGYYGSRGEEVLDESSTSGSGFLTDVVRAWEEATEPASAAGAPVAMARSGLVMDPHGGAFGRLLPMTRLGLAGPLGSGRQFWPWITMADEVRAFAFLLDHPQITGPVNLVGPSPSRQSDVAATVARALHRPHLVPAPAWALRAALGGFADDILASQRVMPARLLEHGFRHHHTDLATAVASLL